MVDDDGVQHGQLRRAREARRLTQAEVVEGLGELAWCRDAIRLGVAPDMVSKWERGEKRPSRRYRELLCLLYGASPAELGLSAAPTNPASVVVDGRNGTLVTDVPWAEVLLALGEPGYLLHKPLIEQWENDLMQRREWLKSMGLAAIASALPVTPPVTRVARFNAQPRADATTLAGLAALTATYQRLYHDAAPQLLMTPIKAHLQTVDGLLSGGVGSNARRVLLANLSQVAQLAGRLSFFDLQDPLTARGYFMTAYDSAVSAGDASLAAGALGHLVFVPAAANQWSAATDHLERARAHAVAGAPSIISSWLAAVSSEIHANAGDDRSARIAIDDAKRALESSSPTVVPEWFDYYDATRLHGFEGYALLRGGHTATAVQHLEEALTRLESSATKQRTVFLTDLAAANVLQGDIDRACDLAAQAAIELRARRYATCVSRLRDFRSSVHPYRTSRAVRELDRAMVEL